jgi:hypothetical protein
MNPILINNGKMPEDPYRIQLGFWLPPDTPYGNLQLKHMKIIQRMDEANRNIQESFFYWNKAHSTNNGMLPINSGEQHYYANEKLIYMLRRGADEIISLIWLLEDFEKKSQFSNKIQIDCIGLLLKQPDTERNPIYTNHIGLLNTLNEISNAYKHSFVNSNLNFLGANEPCVHAITLDRNNTSNQPRFYNVTLLSIIEGYNAFYQETKAWLCLFSERNR